ncbi:unnamed protein product [Blepharisma stoltei]|uniref:Uncharacterized protein n=1 Tax=Blepharisma stoltei TaxID=1481888 RepID=A0AAU9JTE7_9CILI|nr:unnamed protein product [Blepharisma stoltei]
MESNLIESLEIRAKSLSDHLGNYKSLLSQHESVSSTYLKLQREFDNLLIGGIDSSLVQKVQNLTPLLDASDVKGLLVNAFVRSEFVLKYENEIRELARQMEKIEALKRYLDFDPLHNLPEKRKILIALEKKECELTLLFGHKEKQLIYFLEEYDQVINGVNQQLIEWENRLNKLSKKKDI